MVEDSEDGEAVFIPLNFIAQFYNLMDYQRHSVSTLYSADASVVWNENPFLGVDQIETFYDDLPLSHHHIDPNLIQILPIYENSRVLSRKIIRIGNIILILIDGTEYPAMLFHINGLVGYYNYLPWARPFHQLLLVQQQADQQWKIVSDTFYFPE